MKLSEVIAVARVLADSGLWAGQSVEALAARIMAGLELGIGPLTACANVVFENGKMVLTASLQAALLQTSERFDFDVVESTDEVCRILFTDRQENRTREAVYTIQEAQKAGLVDKPGKGGKPGTGTWSKFTGDLLFAACLKRGNKRYCSGLLAGNAAYSPCDLGAEPGPADIVGATAPELNAVVHEPSGQVTALTVDQMVDAAFGPAEPPADPVTDEQLDRLERAGIVLQMTGPEWLEVLERRGVNHPAQLSRRQAADLVTALEHLAEQTGRASTDQLHETLYNERASPPAPEAQNLAVPFEGG